MIDRSMIPSRRTGRISRRFQFPRPILNLRRGVDLSAGDLCPTQSSEIESGVASARAVKHAGATSFRARSAVKIFFTPTAGAEGGSNFLTVQINPGNCGHDNYRPMARSSVTTIPSSHSLLHSTAQRARINHEKQFPVASRPDAALSMLMMRAKSRERERGGRRESLHKQ